MCYRKQLWGTVLLALGAGVLFSSFFPAVFLRVLIGIVLILIGLYFIR